MVAVMMLCNIPFETITDVTLFTILLQTIYYLVVETLWKTLD